MAETAPPIRLSGISHRYGQTDALREVDLEIPSGSSIAVIGPDGVGKSTLLALLSGTKKIQNGTVELFGGDLRRRDHRRRVCSRIAYMPQGLGKNLYPTLSVAENLDFFARLYDQPENERRQRAEELLQATGLSPFRDRPAEKLSGGMKQKLALCCALIHDPDLLILDEPTTGVDPLSRRQFWELIARIQGRRPWMTIVTATAYMSEAERFEHLIAMHDGAILAEGSPEELKAQAKADSLEDAFLALLPHRDGDTGFIPRPKPESMAQNGDTPAIEASGLVMKFGDFTAVDHVDFRIERGEIFGFLGSNGCGKTTTMKMLTGLLTPAEGEARIFGKRVDGDGMEMRRRVGYMSQSFSLYGELTVRQNLDLHAGLFRIGGAEKTERIRELGARFDLAKVMDKRPGSLPLGIRQRLQLAVAVLHKPEMLILDEPTSGVDPVARDGFWNLLTELSREDGVTIFISTHFMNEAERCDRISLMHAGKVLAIDTPNRLVSESGRDTLEEAFIAHLEEASVDEVVPAEDDTITLESAQKRDKTPAIFSPARLWAIARRETSELIRDAIRLAFAIFGPLILMLAMGYGISFDVENMRYAVLDQDRSRESRMVLRQFEGSRYFSAAPELQDAEDLDRRMQRGEISLALILPPGFGRDLIAGRQPEVSAWLDGANTSRAETSRGYVEGAFSAFLSELAIGDTATQGLTEVAVRFRYNQGFTSQQAIPPGVLMMLMIMIPAMLTALGIVREKELGSITNLHASPASRFEFLVGKQLPYIGIALVSFCTMMLMMFLLFDLAPKSSELVLLAGAVLYATAATGFGLLVSTVATSQVAAVFGTAIIVMVPTINFSGMLHPVATLEPAGRMIGQAFPAAYFQKISAGVFNKGLPVAELAPNLAMLAVFCMAYWAISSIALPKQAR